MVEGARSGEGDAENGVNDEMSGGYCARCAHCQGARGGLRDADKSVESLDGDYVYVSEES